MKTGIYKITNKLNGKCYIGQSIFIERRWKDERNGAFNQYDNEYNSARSRAFRKYGLENFNFEVIEECLPSELNEKEIYWIQYYDSYNNGYNETTGGGSAVTSCKMKSDELLIIVKLLLENQLTEQEIAKQTGYSIGTISEINQGHIWVLEGLKYPLRKRVYTTKNKVCPYCGKQIDRKATMCADCYQNKTFNFKTPTKQELILLLKEHKGNMSAIGRLYGVSKTPIKRLIQKYNLEKLITQIKSKPKATSRKVIDDNGNIFETAAAANRFYNTVHVEDVCNGRRKTTAKHSFKWLE